MIVSKGVVYMTFDIILLILVAVIGLLHIRTDEISKFSYWCMYTLALMNILEDVLMHVIV